MARFSSTGGGEGSGAPGPQGPEGDSAYDVAVANGFVGTEQEWLDSLSGGSSADIADFVFTDDSNNTGRSIISLPGDKGMTIAAGEDSDLYITAGDDLYIQTLGTGDDIHLNAADDVRFTTNNENSETETIYEWIMNSEGQFLLPGDGYISNPVSSSGDGYGNETLHLVPDSNLSDDQRIIIDPTSPNHIHIRAGGIQDASTAELILGGEKTNVRVVDSSGTVSVTSKVLDVTNFYPNVNTEVNNTFMTYLANTPNIVQGDYVQVDDVEYYIHTVTTDEEFIYATVSGATFVQDQYYLFRRAMTGIHQWSFTDDGDLVLPDGSPSIINPATPGDITLSAYNGVRLAFAQSQEGSGLIFPDNTVQTTAYTGGSAGTGDITFVNSTISNDTNDDIIIENKNSDGIVKARITLDQSNEQVLIQAINSSSNTFTTGDWTTATWSSNVIQISGTENGVIPFFSGLNGNVTHIQVNNGDIVQYDGASYGPTDLTMYTIPNAPVESDPVTIESLRLIYGITSRINMDYDDETFSIDSNGMDLNLSSDQEINLDSNDDIDLSANNRVRIYGDTNVFINSNGGGEYIGTSIDDDFGNQIATVGNLNSTVSTDMVRFVPNFSATGLEYTGYDETYPTYNSYYVKSGKMVSFVIEVDCSTVTNFGTGQFKLQLPFMPAVGFNHFTGWVWADPNVDPDTGTGHTIINADTAGITDTLDLHYLKQSGGANSPIREGLLVQGTPVTLSTISKIYVNGTYIAQ
jgi:hypothetical protein